MVGKAFSFVRYIIANILVFLAIVLVLELGVRSYAHFFIDGKSFFRESSFISPWISSYDFPPPRIDSNGNGIFRNRAVPVPMKKDQDVFRIVTVGGSTTLNQRPFSVSGVDYALALERLFNRYAEKEIRYEVLNAGSDAYSTAQSLINIEFRLVQFEPDMIILMHNINDLTANYFGSGVTGDYSNKYMEPWFLNPEIQGLSSFSGFLFQSRLLTKVGLPQLLAKERSVDYSMPVTAGSKIFERNLLSIAAICELNNIRLVLLTQPNRMNAFRYGTENDDIKRYDDIVRKVAQDTGLIFVDMHSLFGHDEKYFVDPVHYTPEGIDRFSSILHTEIRNQISRESMRK